MACKVRVQRGRLRFRLRCQGEEWSEGSKLRVTAKNRQRMEARALLISEDMKALELRDWYLKWFPQGNRAAELVPSPPPPAAKPETVRQAYEGWIEKKKPPVVRRSLERDYRQAFNRHILPRLGEMELNKVGLDELDSFRLHLIEAQKLSLKTARNIIDGALRAFFRDSARKLDRNPFSELPKNWWPRLPRREPDPYTELERDTILRYYRSNRPYWAYAFVFFRFYTGTRPSEATALKWGSVDLLAGKAMLSLSRHLGEENAPKTAASRRTITLLPNVVDVLKTLLSLRVEPGAYVFTDAEGHPIDQAEFGRAFGGVLRVLKLRPRPFYNTRHTFISVALTIGCNQKWIAEQTGTSIAMIQEHYGRYIRDDGAELLRNYVANAAESGEEGAEEVKAGTEPGTFAGDADNYAETVVVPTGIEPVFPT
jgi:integrase